MDMLEKTSKSMSTTAILSPVKAIFEKRGATVEVDAFILPGEEDSLEPKTVTARCMNRNRTELGPLWKRFIMQCLTIPRKMQ